MDSDDVRGYDRHQDSRQRKAEKARRGRAMRGNRSVFTIQDIIAKKGRNAKKRLNKGDNDGHD